MKQIDSSWLVDQMARVLDAKINVLTVITTCVSREDSMTYVRAVKNHLETQSELRQTNHPKQSMDENEKGLLQVG
jgi:hypothetical protein